MQAQKTCFISFIKLLFSDLPKRKTIYKARMYSLFFHEAVFLQIGDSQSYRRLLRT